MDMDEMWMPGAYPDAPPQQLLPTDTLNAPTPVDPMVQPR